MIPLRDDQPTFGIPAVTYFLISLNFLIFLFEASLSQRDLHNLFRQFALIPDHVALGLAGQGGGLAGAVFPMFTSMFSAWRVDARDWEHVGLVDLWGQY